MADPNQLGATFEGTLAELSNAMLSSFTSKDVIDIAGLDAATTGCQLCGFGERRGADGDGRVGDRRHTALGSAWRRRFPGDVGSAWRIAGWIVRVMAARIVRVMSALHRGAAICDVVTHRNRAGVAQANACG
jgi:hypothetical protein